MAQSVEGRTVQTEKRGHQGGRLLMGSTKSLTGEKRPTRRKDDNIGMLGAERGFRWD